MIKKSMTVGQFMDRPQKQQNRPRRSILLMRIPVGKKTARVIRYLFKEKASETQTTA
jgi:hypothetical protein